ncbi:hypothetical protein FRB99_005923 [Tulasnella sp. 403]|nr:hypothetical protein FRB99_005923 [Tulasnella sp. 403]
MLHRRCATLAASILAARRAYPAVSTTNRVYAQRSFRTSVIARAGLTNLLDEIGAPAPPVQVKRMTTDGIELVDGLLLQSSCIFINGRVFLWNVPQVKEGSWSGWTKEMFEIFDVVIPKPEVLLFGTGNAPLPLSQELRQYLTSIGIAVEIMDTWNACSTYNLLSEEGRQVAAALIFPDAAPWKAGNAK